MFDQCVTKVTPEFSAFSIEHTQLQRYSSKRRSSAEDAHGVFLGPFLRSSLQRIKSSPVVLARVVYRAHNRFKADNKTSHDFHSVTLDPFYRVKQVAAVLRLLSFLQAIFHRSLNAKKHPSEARLPHAFEQRFVVSQIYTGFSEEREGIVVPLLPIRQLRQQASNILFIADEVIVDDEHCAAPAEREQSIEFSQHLRVALGARDAAVDFNDVAKLAVEGTTARVLDRHRTVTLHVCEMKIRNRGHRKRRLFCRLVGSLGCSAFQVFEKLRHRGFRFADKNVVCFRQSFQRSRHVRPSDNDSLSSCFAFAQDLSQGILLYQHRSGHHYIGPFDIGRSQLAHIQINQTTFPCARQQGRNS